jgi:hypothetical protein
MFFGTHPFLHTLHALWRNRIALFVPFWLSITLVASVLTLALVARRKRAAGGFRQPSDPGTLGLEIPAITILGLFLAGYIALSLVWEDFAYYDDSLFTLGTLSGQNIPPFIWPDLGRFFPLCDQEYNLLRHVTSSIVGYHSLRILELVALSGILLGFLSEVKIKARVALILLILITPGILISFGGLIYPEANLIFFLICLAWSVRQFEKTRSLVWVAASVIAAQFMLYYKETVFLMIVTFAIVRIFLRCSNGANQTWDWSKIWSPEGVLDICLAMLSVPFLAYYVAAMYPHYRTGYEDKFRVSFAQLISAYFKIDLLAWAFFAVVLVRLVWILRRKVLPSPLWDGLALGGCAYMLGYVALRLHAAYYFAPADVIAVLCLGRLLFLSWKQLSGGARACIYAVLVLVVLQDLALSAFRVYERKNVIHAKVELAERFKQQYDRDPQSVQRLYFPAAIPVHIMEFGAYLNYRGVAVRRVANDSEVTRGVVLVGQSIRKDGACVGGKPLACQRAAEPAPGDLIVQLPDDSSPDNNPNAPEHGDARLFAYDPTPSIPGWLKPLFGRLHVISPEFSRDTLPATFLQASITARK